MKTMKQGNALVPVPNNLFEEADKIKIREVNSKLRIAIKLN